MNITEQLVSYSPVLSFLLFVMLSLIVLKANKKILSQQQKLSELHNELNALLSCSRGISNKLHHYQHQFHTITERQDQLEVGDVESSSYKQAIALYKRGASEEELLTTCDLSMGELNLISHLQQAKSRKRTAA